MRMSSDQERRKTRTRTPSPKSLMLVIPIVPFRTLSSLRNVVIS